LGQAVEAPSPPRRSARGIVVVFIVVAAAVIAIAVVVGVVESVAKTHAHTAVFALSGAAVAETETVGAGAETGN
jgi:hypothetical protein